jgi:hypothetical protein
MKYFLSTALVTLALLVGAVGGAPVAHAQSEALVDSPLTEQQANQAAESAAAAPVSPVGSTMPTNSELGKGVGEGFGQVMIWIMTLFAWLVGVAAMTLNWAVYYTVVTMGDYVNNLTAVGVTWRILRDVANIMLIFGFLGAGIATILNVEKFGWSTKMLPMLLVGAIFLNFSLFVSEAMIDGTNLFATQFYKQINGGALPTPADMAKMTPASEGISNKIMGQLGLQSIYGDVRNTDRAKVLLAAGNSWVIGFMGILLFIVAAFVMFSLAFILIARFVALIFFIILSPVGFMGLAIPQMQYRAGQWWKNFLEQIITAPVLMLLLYVALAVITDAQFLTGFGAGKNSGGFTGFLSSETGMNNLPGLASMMLSFLVAMGLLLVVVIKAKSMSAFGAGMATKAAGSLTFGATAWGMRNSGGWLANKGANYLRHTAVARIPLAGTGLVKGLDKVGSASFDVRGAKVGGGLKGIGVDAGEAQKGGYKADLKSRIESRTKYAADLKGRELTDDEKAVLAPMQNELSRLEKLRARVRTPEQFKALSEQIKTQEKAIAEKEEPTDKGAKRKYASALNLWMDEKGTFNKYFNFAANTEAAKKIREDAKKSKDDKELDTLRKALKKAGEGDEGAGASGGGAAGGGVVATAGGAAPTGGGAAPAAGGHA